MAPLFLSLSLTHTHFVVVGGGVRVLFLPINKKKKINNFVNIIMHHIHGCSITERKLHIHNTLHHRIMKSLFHHSLPPPTNPATHKQIYNTGTGIP